MMPTPATTLHGRHTAGFEDRLAQTRALLDQAARQHAGRIVQATSLGAEDMVVTDLIAELNLDIALATLDTGLLHVETQVLLDQVQARYGRAVQRFEPETDQVVRFVGRHGERAMFESVDLRKACCALRKLEPLKRLLHGRTAWVTGLRREQSEGRGAVQAIETGSDGRDKISPLADWRWHDVWHYIATRRVPHNVLHDQFFPSIGCAPCTRAVALGEDARAGRWWWEQEAAKECGLHARAPTNEVSA
jgi:phosphoadenosine phosphosulfate reductase